MTVKSITGEEWDDEVINKKGVTVVDFWGEGCAPCKTLAPIIESYADENPDKNVLKVNFNDAIEVAVSLELRGVPSLYLFIDGKLNKSHTGVMSKSELGKWVDSPLTF